MKYLIVIALLIASFALPSAKVQAQAGKEKKVEVKVLYFHGPIRCHSCIQIENDTKATMDNLFKKETKSGAVSLDIINFVDDETGKWEKMYNLETQTLIVAKFVDGKQTEWKNLEKIWDFSGNYPKFSKYLSDEVKKYMK